MREEANESAQPLDRAWTIRTDRIRVPAPRLELGTRIITVYLDKKEFQASLDIPNDDSIHWFVADHATKKILMRDTGNISSEQIDFIKSQKNS